MSDSPTWIITTSSDRSAAEVAKDLRAAGFAVGEVLGEIGVITGKGPKGLVSTLRKIRGVADVSPELEVDVGPPDETIG